jgi:bifunctional UDP-N-acetylglucosamine pyrophosphorylase/glucosamine-1-phosphate N-acetyltransferase
VAERKGEHVTDSNLAIVILAAGKGTRMKSATPKLLHKLAGVTVVSHVLATARELDAAHVVTVVRHERDRLVEVIEVDLPTSIIVDQDDVPGTGRAVEQAMDALPADFAGEVLVLNGDVPLLDADTLVAALTAHRESGVAATLLTTHLDDAHGYGRIIRGESDLVDRIVEHVDATDSERAVREINAGIYVFTASPLRTALTRITQSNAQGEKYLTDVVAILRSDSLSVMASPVSPAWKVEGINDRAQLASAAARLNAMIIRGWQLQGVTVIDPATTWIDMQVQLGLDVEIKPGTQILGASAIEERAVIGPDTTLVDTEVGAGALVKRTDATLAVIGAGAEVGPFSYLRPGTYLGEDGKIGTFVETKNAKIGAGSKVPHLSYIGDAEVGEKSNIGAGTIVANYDGVNKHRTTVGSHVRTGSHNVFVAPVVIGDGAYSGAGTVIRKDVPAGALAVNVAPQRNMDGWVVEHRPGTAAAEAAQSATNTPNND